MSALREALEALVAGPYRLINDCGMTVAWVDPEDLRAVLAAHDDPPRPEGEGWVPMGTHAYCHVAVEFAGHDDGGMPIWERVRFGERGRAIADPPASVGVERVEWGVQGERQVMRMPGEGNARWYAETTGLPVVRRTVTSYPDVVGEWEEVGE